MKKETETESIRELLDIHFEALEKLNKTKCTLKESVTAVYNNFIDYMMTEYGAIPKDVYFIKEYLNDLCLRAVFFGKKDITNHKQEIYNETGFKLTNAEAYNAYNIDTLTFVYDYHENLQNND